MHKAVITITCSIRFQRIEHHITASQPERSKVNRVPGLKKKKTCYNIEEVVMKEYLKGCLVLSIQLSKYFNFCLLHMYM